MQIDGKDQVITLKSICIQSLVGAADDPSRKIDPSKKITYWRLARIIEEGGEIELTSEEITDIKSAVGDFPSVLIVGQAYDLLEGKNPFKKEK